jgi:hypothetical protein
MKRADVWGVTPCGCSHRIFSQRTLLLITANVVPSSPINVTLMMEAIRSYSYKSHTA